MRFVHVYAKPEPDRVRAVAPRHAAYWHGLGLGGYLGGSFDDRSGGLISFEADSREEAERLIAADPFVREELLASPSIGTMTRGSLRQGSPSPGVGRSISASPSA
jgi:uncharacterized protein YciI